MSKAQTKIKGLLKFLREEKSEIKEKTEKDLKEMQILFVDAASSMQDMIDLVNEENPDEEKSELALAGFLSKMVLLQMKVEKLTK